MKPFRYNIEKYSVRQLLTIPLILLIISSVILTNTMVFSSHGMPITPGLQFVGGTTLTLSHVTETPDELKRIFSEYPLDDAIIVSTSGDTKTLNFKHMDSLRLKRFHEFVDEKYPKQASTRDIAPETGRSLLNRALLALLFSFIGMMVVVFIAFRTLVPAGAVVFAAISDIVVTAAVMNLFGITMSMGTVAALLMLIGYSVDSDILLTNRVLTRKGSLNERFAGAFHTGFVMTTTTLAAISAMFVVSWLWNIEIIYDISAVLIIGLIADMINTWLANVAILKWYISKKGDIQ